jgi:hypothetical protein
VFKKIDRLYVFAAVAAAGSLLEYIDSLNGACEAEKRRDAEDARGRRVATRGSGIASTPSGDADGLAEAAELAAAQEDLAAIVHVRPVSRDGSSVAHIALPQAAFALLLFHVGLASCAEGAH